MDQVIDGVDDSVWGKGKLWRGPDTIPGSLVDWAWLLCLLDVLQTVLMDWIQRPSHWGLGM